MPLDRVSSTRPEPNSALRQGAGGCKGGDAAEKGVGAEVVAEAVEHGPGDYPREGCDRSSLSRQRCSGGYLADRNATAARVGG